MAWNQPFPLTEITNGITSKTVDYAQKFGNYLGTKGETLDRKGNPKELGPLTTNQLRRFFGEVKRQELRGYNESQFVLLKPKLAYAVGRDKGKSKIGDFYSVIDKMIDAVHDQKSFENFIQIFEAIVAFHKATYMD